MVMLKQPLQHILTPCVATSSRVSCLEIQMIKYKLTQ